MTPIRIASLACLFVGFVTHGLRGEDDLSFEPYTVYVSEADSYARCGPSEDYYRTDPLRHGQALEVYAETDDGWLGIRPPDESFCWVQAETIDLSDGGDTGTVSEDRTVAWIGTHLGRARSYRWQVQMAAGETVTVIGKSECDGPDGPQLWYRIVPPSGEYRWVHRGQVVASSEELVAAAQAVPQQRGAQPQEPSGSSQRLRSAAVPQGTPSASPAIERGVIESPTEPVPGDLETWQDAEGRLAADATADGDAALERAPAEIPAASGVASMEFIGRPRLLEIGSQPTAPLASSQAGDTNWVIGTSPRNQLLMTSATATTTQPIEQVSGQQPLSARAWPAASMPNAAPLRIVSPDRISQIEAEVRAADVTRLDLIFSRLIAAQATAAEMEPVYRAAQQLSFSDADPILAGRARMLAERADQYRRIASRRDGQTLLGPSAGQQILVPATGVVPAAVGAAEMVNAPAADPSLDGDMAMTGQLVQVYSVRRDSPPFALTDPAGRTVAYVTPTPGINLRVHLNSLVRVIGRQGYLTGLNTPHILASQAVRVAE